MDLLDGNRLTLLESGTGYFPALEAAIASARHEVYLETYIFADDTIGRRIARALAEATAQGVRTHVIVDGLTVKRYSGGIRARLLAANVSLGILPAQPNSSRKPFFAPTWYKNIVGAAFPKEFPEIREGVHQLMDKFIKEYQAANPKP